MTSKLGTLITILLLATIAISSIVAWSRYSPSRPVEITIPPAQQVQGRIYIGGAVSNPGFYSLKFGDTIEALILAAGGATDDADFNQLKLYLPQIDEAEQPQKISINRAEAWLLEALPGIGPVLAQRIVDYRNQYGQFNHINELLEVEGIGSATYERIKHLITVD